MAVVLGGDPLGGVTRVVIRPLYAPLEKRPPVRLGCHFRRRCRTSLAAGLSLCWDARLPSMPQVGCQWLWLLLRVWLPTS